MRLLIVVGIAGLALVSCQRNEPVVKELPELPLITHDTLRIEPTCDTAKYVYMIDSIKRKNDTLARRLLAVKFQITTIRYYANIINNAHKKKDSSKDKFLLGWVNRALKD